MGSERVLPRTSCHCTDAIYTSARLPLSCGTYYICVPLPYRRRSDCVWLLIRGSGTQTFIYAVTLTAVSVCGL